MVAQIKTERLVLIPATTDHLKAELELPPRIGQLLNAIVPASWPPGEYDRGAQEFFLGLMEEKGPAMVGWLGWYGIFRGESGHPEGHADTLPEAHADTLIGAAGYFGPPSPQGWVELGYSVCPEFQNRGFATEMTLALAKHAKSFPGVHQILAHTGPENLASIKVLQKAGFELVGPGANPGTLKFEWKETNK